MADISIPAKEGKKTWGPLKLFFTLFKSSLGIFIARSYFFDFIG